ncbi:ketopantoate reductase family protein [Leucobacter celer]|uniref:ketopantoate reductase family protein n=1 Tax=Leucobacter celer TaxID=668625 RepID=UPI0006A7EC7B|nr:2-dehydropantoate 2-reductase N-terminal domain-containing protein [Leucobacter celer]
MTGPRIAVFGAGANGGAIAASLAEAGADVVAIDPWPAHVEAVRDRGLTVVTSETERTSRVPALHLCQLAENRRMFDVIVLGVKAYDTRWACRLLSPYLAEDGTVIAVQNGVTLDTVAEIFGADRSVGAVIEVAANLFTPARIVQEAPMWLALGGETGAAQDRAHRAAALLAPAATTVVVEDIRSAKWMKLVANACELVPSAILDLPLAEAIAEPGMHAFMLECGQEALDAALTQGQRIVPIFGSDGDGTELTRERYVGHLLDIVLNDYTFPSTLTTVLQDWRKGRRAEIDELNGLVVVAAGGPEHAPLNHRVHRLAREIESGSRPAERMNAQLLLG